MSTPTLRSTGPEFVCPECLTADARPAERCPGCRRLLQLDVCALEPWEVDGSSAFAARRRDGTLVAISPGFHAGDRERPEQTRESATARHELVAALVEQGWRLAAGRREGPWFATRLERVIAVESPEFAAAPTDTGEPPTAAAPPPAPAAGSPEPRQWSASLTQVLSVAGLTAAVALAYVVVEQSPHGQTRLVTITSAASAPSKKLRPAPLTSAANKAVTLAAPEKKVELAVTARRTSWLELRRGSRTGKLVYAGKLRAGHSIHVSARSIWARFRAAAALKIVVDGHRVRLRGTLDRVFTRT